jgi:hypothetical protein
MLRTFEHQRQEVTAVFRKLRNEELHYLYSPDIISVIKARRVKWQRHKIRMGYER